MSSTIKKDFTNPSYGKRNVTFEDGINYPKSSTSPMEYDEEYLQTSAGKAVHAIIFLFVFLQKISKYFTVKKKIKCLEDSYNELAENFPILDWILAFYLGIILKIIQIVPFFIRNIVDKTLCFILERFEKLFEYIEEQKRWEHNCICSTHVRRRCPRHANLGNHHHKHGHIKRSITLEVATTEPLGLL